MSAADKVKAAMDLMREGFDKMKEANGIMGGGPHSYYAERMVEYADMLFSRYAPFKQGDRAIICEAPDCNNGWSSHKQDLVKGAKCTVAGIDLYKGEWRIDVVLDEETWIDRDGKRQLVSNKHTFCLREVVSQFAFERSRICGNSGQTETLPCVKRSL